MDLRNKTKDELLIYIDRLKNQIEIPIKQSGEEYSLRLNISNSLFQIINPMKSDILGLPFEIYFEDNLLNIKNTLING